MSICTNSFGTLRGPPWDPLGPPGASRGLLGPPEELLGLPGDSRENPLGPPRQPLALKAWGLPWGLPGLPGDLANRLEIFQDPRRLPLDLTKPSRHPGSPGNPQDTHLLWPYHLPLF